MLVQVNAKAVPETGLVSAANVLQAQAARGASKTNLAAVKKQLIDAWASADELSKQNAAELFKVFMPQAV